VFSNLIRLSKSYHTEFLTGTIFSWHHLLENDEFKKVITGSFQWLANKERLLRGRQQKPRPQTCARLNTPTLNSAF